MSEAHRERHWVRDVARVIEGVTMWTWSCDTCARRGEWLPEHARARADGGVHMLYPDGLGDADAALRQWSEKR